MRFIVVFESELERFNQYVGEYIRIETEKPFMKEKKYNLAHFAVHKAIGAGALSALSAVNQKISDEEGADLMRIAFDKKDLNKNQFFKKAMSALESYDYMTITILTNNNTIQWSFIAPKKSIDKVFSTYEKFLSSKTE